MSAIGVKMSEKWESYCFNQLVRSAVRRSRIESLSDKEPHGVHHSVRTHSCSLVRGK